DCERVSQKAAPFRFGSYGRAAGPPELQKRKTQGLTPTTPATAPASAPTRGHKKLLDEQLTSDSPRWWLEVEDGRSALGPRRPKEKPLPGREKVRVDGV
ncbi:MAG: hypothetical protein ACE5MK_03050, partial [Acidobacteriota bacterium]